MIVSIISQMDVGLQALFFFYTVSSLIALSVANFAYKTASKKQEKIASYNLNLAKLMTVIMPLIPVWFFTIKLIILS